VFLGEMLDLWHDKQTCVEFHWNHSLHQVWPSKVSPPEPKWHSVSRISTPEWCTPCQRERNNHRRLRNCKHLKTLWFPVRHRHGRIRMRTKVAAAEIKRTDSCQHCDSDKLSNRALPPLQPLPMIIAHERALSYVEVDVVAAFFRDDNDLPCAMCK
jgi:hypothetical protein